MEIHRPKPWHGWRAFLKEYAIIVVGVLTALAGEQAVEAVHWRHEVAETERAVRTELALDVGALRFRQNQSACFNRRVAELSLLYEGWRTGQPKSTARAISQPLMYGYQTDAWQVAETGQVAAHIPLEKRIRYAQIYGQMRLLDGLQGEEADVWRELAQFEGTAAVPDGHDLMRLRGLISNLKRAEVVRTFNLVTLEARAEPLGVKPEARVPGNVAVQKAFCASLFAAG